MGGVLDEVHARPTQELTCLAARDDATAVELQDDHLARGILRRLVRLAQQCRQAFIQLDLDGVHEAPLLAYPAKLTW